VAGIRSKILRGEENLLALVARIPFGEIASVLGRAANLSLGSVARMRSALRQSAIRWKQDWGSPWNWPRGISSAGLFHGPRSAEPFWFFQRL